jgi:hypothetical protein
VPRGLASGRFASGLSLEAFKRLLFSFFLMARYTIEVNGRYLTSPAYLIASYPFAPMGLARCASQCGAFITLAKNMTAHA